MDVIIHASEPGLPIHGVPVTDTARSNIACYRKIATNKQLVVVGGNDLYIASRPATKRLPCASIPSGGSSYSNNLTGVVVGSSCNNLSVVGGQAIHVSVQAARHRLPGPAGPTRHMIRRNTAGCREFPTCNQIAVEGHEGAHVGIHSRSHRFPTSAIPTRDSLDRLTIHTCKRTGGDQFTF